MPIAFRNEVCEQGCVRGCELCRTERSHLACDAKLQGITLLVDHDRGGSVLTDRRTSLYGTPNRAENDARRDLTRAKEEVLIRRVLGGDKDSFLDLIQPYQRTVYATTASMLESKEDAEDPTQDVLLKALARLQQFRRESAFGTWLIQIAINEARMRRRKLRHGRMLSLTNGADDDGTYVPKDFEDWREIPLEALERSEIRDALTNALALLEEHYRVAFILRDVNEFVWVLLLSLEGVSAIR